MVQVNITRQSQEILGDETLTAGVTRSDVQVLADFAGTEQVNITRQAIEVLSPEPDIAGCTRSDVQVLADFAGTEQVNVTRQAIEVLGGDAPKGGVSRSDVQVLADFAGTEQVNITRQSIEALARQGSAGPVVPLALGADAHIFLHNWVTKARLKTSFRTSIAASPDSGAESRRGLSLKPFRTMDLEWSVCDRNTTTGVNSLKDLERLEVLLRRMTDARFQVPIYKDQKILTQSYISTETVIFFNTDDARFFPGQRVAIVQLDNDNQPVSHSFHTIDTLENTFLVLDAQLGVEVASGSLVFPMMDCETMLGVKLTFTTARVPKLKMTVAEAPGASQLPPIKSDTPLNANIAHDDRPVWRTEPDWSSPVTKGRDRQGGRSSDGRADFVDIQGDRSRQTHKYSIVGTRQEMWEALAFFETRRGRLRSFWHIDQDQYFELVAIDAGGGDVGISENDLDLANTQEEFDALGLVMADGTHYVRDITSILAILTVYTVTLGTNLPSGLLVADAHRVARARLCRFASDEFTETWTHTGLMAATVNVIEVLNETDFEL
jgi:hypothetical protein